MFPPRFSRDSRGASAVEFAIIAPTLALMILGVIDGYSLATSVLSMRAAVQAAANYYIGGGSNEAAAQQIVMSAWRDAPNDAGTTVERTCKCAGVVVSCSGLCAATSKPPETYLHIAATATWTAPYSVDWIGATASLTQDQVVRVR